MPCFYYDALRAFVSGFPPVLLAVCSRVGLRRTAQRLSYLGTHIGLHGRGLGRIALGAGHVEDNGSGLSVFHFGDRREGAEELVGECGLYVGP